MRDKVEIFEHGQGPHKTGALRHVVDLAKAAPLDPGDACRWPAMKEMAPPRSAGQLSRSNATFWPCGARELGLRNEEAHEDLFPGAAATPPVLRPPASLAADASARKTNLPPFDLE